MAATPLPEAWRSNHAGRIFADDQAAAARAVRSGPAHSSLRESSDSRAAQAYMLISMPTGNSTIWGAFQDMFKTPRDFIAKPQLVFADHHVGEDRSSMFRGCLRSFLKCTMKCEVEIRASR